MTDSFTTYLRKIAGVVLLALTLSIASCGSKKTVSQATYTGQTTERVLSTESDMRVAMRQIVASYGNWERLRVPLNVGIRSPKRISVSATAVMERGKSLLLSLKFFGFEVGSLYLTDTTIRIIDKANKNYIEESISDFCAGFPITVSNVQDLLLGRVFIAGEQQAEINQLLKSKTEILSPTEWMLDMTPPVEGINYGYDFNPADILKALIVQASGNQPVTIVYGLPVTTDCGPMASSATFSYQTPKTLIDATLDWNFSKARWNEDVELREPSVGKDYRRISAADIAKMLSQM